MGLIPPGAQTAASVAFPWPAAEHRQAAPPRSAYFFGSTSGVIPETSDATVVSIVFSIW
jgi:hypothetical protein